MGSHKQRVLLIGGPQHGELVDLAEGCELYEFTSMKMLLPVNSRDPWANWPESSTHRYKLDQRLTNLVFWGNTHAAAPVIIFTHEVLWGSPIQGGFNLWALSDALRTLEKAKADLEEVRISRRDDQADAVKLNKECDEWQKKYASLLDYSHDLEQMLRSVRQNLEMAFQAVGGAIAETGLDYESPFDGD